MRYMRMRRDFTTPTSHLDMFSQASNTKIKFPLRSTSHPRSSSGLAPIPTLGPGTICLDLLRIPYRNRQAAMKPTASGPLTVWPIRKGGSKSRKTRVPRTKPANFHVTPKAIPKIVSKSFANSYRSFRGVHHPPSRKRVGLVADAQYVYRTAVLGGTLARMK
jgi:hypothetical protein